MSIKIRAAISPNGKQITIIKACTIHNAPAFNDVNPKLNIARYIYKPGTMITIEGTVIAILGKPILRLIIDASIPATKAPIKAATAGGTFELS